MTLGDIKCGQGDVLFADVAEVRHSTEREAILSALAEADSEALTPNQIAATIGMKAVNVRNLLGKMKREGMVKTASYGRYTLNVVGADEPAAEADGRVRPCTDATGRPL